VLLQVEAQGADFEGFSKRRRELPEISKVGKILRKKKTEGG